MDQSDTDTDTLPRKAGRPPSIAPFRRLLHVRISDEMDEWLSQIADARLDRPSVTQLVREALAQYIDRERSRG